jgi:hypothetical protein
MDAMTIYLTGLLIDSAALLAVGGYYLYFVLTKKEFLDPKHYYWIVMTLIGAAVVASLYFILIGDLEMASILVWIMAVPVIAAVLFIILIIIFRPDWN